MAIRKSDENGTNELPYIYNLSEVVWFFTGVSLLNILSEPCEEITPGRVTFSWQYFRTVRSTARSKMSEKEGSAQRENRTLDRDTCLSVREFPLSLSPHDSQLWKSQRQKLTK